MIPWLEAFAFDKRVNLHRYVAAPVLAVVGVVLPSWLACGAFVGVFGAFVYAGTGPAEKLNSVCLAFAIAAYASVGAVTAVEHTVCKPFCV